MRCSLLTPVLAAMVLSAWATPMHAEASENGVPQQPPFANNTTLPVHFGVLVFPHFQALDVFGPLDVLNSMSMLYKNATMHLSVFSKTMDPVSTGMVMGGMPGFGESIVPTTTFEEAIANKGTCSESAAGHHVSMNHVSARHADMDHGDMDMEMPMDNTTAPHYGPLDVLIVPGGGGTRSNMSAEIGFVKAMYPKVKYIISVCTGASIVARAGVMDGRNATTNKRSWDWATSTGPNVNWIRQARWVDDGNVWSSSGISAGIDVTYAWVGHVYGEEVADYLAKSAEYDRWTDAHNDPFADIWDPSKPAS